MTNCNSPGFLGTVLASMLGCAIVIGGCDRISTLESKIDRLIKQQSTAVNELRTENMFGNSSPEKYFLINEQKAYTQIDGKDIQTYFAERQ